MSIGPGPATSALGGSALLVGMASPPSDRSQALPLQEQRRAASMNYNCSINFPSEQRGGSPKPLEVVPSTFDYEKRTGHSDACAEFRVCCVDRPTLNPQLVNLLQRGRSLLIIWLREASNPFPILRPSKAALTNLQTIRMLAIRGAGKMEKTTKRTLLKRGDHGRFRGRQAGGEKAHVRGEPAHATLSVAVLANLARNRWFCRTPGEAVGHLPGRSLSGFQAASILALSRSKPALP